MHKIAKMLQILFVKFTDWQVWIITISDASKIHWSRKQHAGSFFHSKIDKFQKKTDWVSREQWHACTQQQMFHLDCRVHWPTGLDACQSFTSTCLEKLCADLNLHSTADKFHTITNINAGRNKKQMGKQQRDRYCWQVLCKSVRYTWETCMYISLSGYFRWNVFWLIFAINSSQEVHQLTSSTGKFSESNVCLQFDSQLQEQFTNATTN